MVRHVIPVSSTTTAKELSDKLDAFATLYDDQNPDVEFRGVVEVSVEEGRGHRERHFEDWHPVLYVGNTILILKHDDPTSKNGIVVKLPYSAEDGFIAFSTRR